MSSEFTYNVGTSSQVLQLFSCTEFWIFCLISVITVRRAPYGFGFGCA